MGFNPDFHKRKSIRLKGFDYSQPGLYFVTICVKDRSHWFGEIKNGQMLFSKIGETVKQCWSDITKHYPRVQLERFAIMPNHLHSIVAILPGNAVRSAQSLDIGSQSENTNNPTRPQNVGVQNFEPLHFASRNPDITENRFQHIIPRSLGSIIRGFKIGVRKWCRNYNDAEYGHFRWQRNFYDHVIRQQPDLRRIQTYIDRNVTRWEEDIENEEFVTKITDKIRRMEYCDLSKIE